MLTHFSFLIWKKIIASLRSSLDMINPSQSWWTTWYHGHMNSSSIRAIDLAASFHFAILPEVRGHGRVQGPRWKNDGGSNQGLVVTVGCVNPTVGIIWHIWIWFSCFTRNCSQPKKHRDFFHQLTNQSLVENQLERIATHVLNVVVATQNPSDLY